MGNVIVTGSFDDLRSRDVRFLQEASRLGPLHVLLFRDENITRKFPLNERLYFLQSLRYVANVTPIPTPTTPDGFPMPHARCWAVRESQDTTAERDFCNRNRIDYHIIPDRQLADFPIDEPEQQPSSKRKVLVTGCYDWLHTGHIRFFEEVSEYGDVYAVVGHDANITLLKGPGHPQFNEAERRYMVHSIRFVKQALISTGNGWLDAEPEIRRIKPDIYAVNEDGDKYEKKDYCRQHGIEYLVLKRLPKDGLPKRQSTSLRGF